MLSGNCVQFLSQGEDFSSTIWFNTEGINIVVDCLHVLGHLFALE
jgi:hypothetical protein